MLAILLVACLTAALASVYQWEIRRRSIELDYGLQPEAQKAFGLVLGAANQLAGCACVWRVTTERSISDSVERKRQAGATSLVDRHLVTVGSGTPDWLTVNVPLPCIRRPGQTLYFLPDGVLVDDSSGLAHVQYDDLRFGADSERFIEGQVAPHDSVVEGFTWLHPNKDGSPDARFANNRQLPICHYGIVRIASPGGLNLYLQTSRLSAADGFVAHLKAANATPAELRSCILVDEVFSESARQGISRFGRTLILAIDEVFKTVSGRGNDLIYKFLWVLFAAFLAGSLAQIAWQVAN